MRAVFDHVDDIATNIRMYWFKTIRPLNHTAGQFIQLTLPHKNADQRGEKRWFTVSSSPSEDLVAITTKFPDKNLPKSSFKQRLETLKPGEEVVMSDPMGDFVLPKDETIDLVFVAGGIGVTPYRSIVKWLHDTNRHRSIHLIYGANTYDEIAFYDLFQAYGAKIDVVLKTPPSDWKGEIGLLSSEKILTLIQHDLHKRIYLSGPEPMVEQLVKDLVEQGISKQQLVTDSFLGYQHI